ncbi:serine--tRNA ligase [Paenibacillus tarimensis]
MLDMKWIRQHPETVQTAANRKGISISIPDLLASDDRKRRLQQEVDDMRRERNKLSEEIGRLMKQGLAAQAEQQRQAAKGLNDRLGAKEALLAEEERNFSEMLMRVPNIVSPDTPVGGSDADNVEVKRAGELPVFDFEPKDHVALGALHDMIDIPRGVKTAGSRHYFLKGTGVLLHRAVQQLALDLLLGKGFTPLEVPLIVRGEALWNTGFFPDGQAQTYKLEDGDQWLTGTSEVSLVSYYSNEIVDLIEPIRLAAVSTCFRSEVGSAGKDVHGLYRVHQFAKVEQVIVCEADPVLSERMLQQITGNSEELLRLLELPYRVMAVCTGDMAQKTYKQYDIETWMPSRESYGETHSASNLHDYQARRSNIRYRDSNGSLKYCHTLNNTAVASPRILIPLIENHQEEDGSIRIPKALRPYLGGVERLIPHRTDT